MPSHTAVHSYEVIAHNYAHDSANKIHDDEMAARYGFQGGLVPGVADFAYLSRAAFARFGPQWMRGGTMEAKFIKPVYDGERATASATDITDVTNAVTLSLSNPQGVCCAVGQASLHDDAPPPRIDDWPHRESLAEEERPLPTLSDFSAGRTLASVDYTHDDVAAREQSRSLFVEALISASGDPLWHPALCLWYANRVVVENLQLQAWVHTASRVHYFDHPHQGEAVSVRGKVANTYDKRGHVVTELDIAMFADTQRALAKIHHTAIIRLAHAPT